jgi:hypothetical protein
MRFVNDHSRNYSSLPVVEESWPRQPELSIEQDGLDEALQLEVKDYCEKKPWIWTGRRVYFFCDIHADADAFFLSLEACGGINRTGLEDEDFELSDAGKQARFVIGGDCFDKGPSNLRLLEVIHQLYVKGAEIELLAGNHDVRTYLGIYYAESKDVRLDHLFVRMGKKTVPLLKEMYDLYIDAVHDPQPLLADAEIRDLLFPADSWFENFPLAAKDWIAERKLQKELVRIREKTREFDETMTSVGLDLSKVYAAVKKFRELFFEPEGRYYWFFSKMKLAHREGSYLYVHAGMDDQIAEALFNGGTERLNEQFNEKFSSDPFALYHGVLGNVFRTKYREFEYKLSAAGVEHLHQAGIYAVVHGHQKLMHGQRLIVREGMLNFECDASVDCNTRKVTGLIGPGAATVVFEPDGRVRGISTDYPFIKVFRPDYITVAPLP